MKIFNFTRSQSVALGLTFLLLAGPLAPIWAQLASEPVSTNTLQAPPTPPPQSPEPEPTAVPEPAPAPAAPSSEVAPNSADQPAPPAIPRPVRTSSPASPGQPDQDGVRMNFQGAPLSEVLNYLSEAAGFVIVHEGEVNGNVNVVSHQALSSEEAVDLLNTILLEKGYVAIRNGRILKIVSRDQAPRLDLPVRTGSNPNDIPRKDEMVTQIIPVRYLDATRVIENLRPLLAEDATLTANESSNSILLTDTLTNIRRTAQIIYALDTSISGISTMRVFPLQYADATQLAEVIQQLFSSSSSSRGSSRGGGRGGFFDRFRMEGGGDRGGPGGSRGGSTGQSEARQASSRVIAVADERSNSLVVSAPEELMPTIDQLVKEMDTSITDLTEVRVFRLENADAMELADIITELFAEDTTSRNDRSSGFRPPWMPPRPEDNSRGQNGSQRALVQSKVIAVGDRRTNSLLVSAARQMMSYIAEMVGRLDASTDKKQRVFVYPLEHADVDNVATILRGMFEDQGVGSRGATGTQTVNPLTDRSSTGASSDITSSFGSRRTTR